MDFCDGQQWTGFVVEVSAEAWANHDISLCCIPNLKPYTDPPVAYKVPLGIQSLEADWWILSFTHSLD